MIGLLDAPSQTAAIQEIRNRGNYPIEASEGGAAAPRWRQALAANIRPQKRLSARALVVATQELSALLRAGLELDRALEILVNLDETKAMRVTFTGILDRGARRRQPCRCPR